jgi:uncharacterized protein (DUF2141 family)
MRAALAANRLLLAVPALCLMSAAMPETRITVTLPQGLAGDAGGRLLVFAEPATPANATADAVDLGNPDESVAVAARDVTRFGPERRTTIDTAEAAFPASFATLPPGSYRVQVVLDRNGDYNYGGRGPGDLISRVETVSFPLTAAPTITLERAIPPAADQFDTTGFPPGAVAQIAASRSHLHEEWIASPALSRFRGSNQSVQAWVLTPPGYDPKARTTYPTVFTAGGFGATHKLDGQQLHTNGTSWRRARSRR